MERRTDPMRSKIMRSIRTKHTGLEKLVRKILYAEGFRYRLFAKELPGQPDIVFRKFKKVIFVHGCFWHGHDCKLGRLPKTNIEFWSTKIHNNHARDERACQELNRLGWQTLVIWQCMTKDVVALKKILQDYMKQEIPGGTGMNI
jgi:DNA mismatch endonuclease, patch repair protein